LFVFEAGQAALQSRKAAIGIGAAIELQLGRFELYTTSRQFGCRDDVVASL